MSIGERLIIRTVKTFFLPGIPTATPATPSPSLAPTPGRSRPRVTVTSRGQGRLAAEGQGRAGQETEGGQAGAAADTAAALINNRFTGFETFRLNWYFIYFDILFVKAQ